MTLDDARVRRIAHAREFVHRSIEAGLHRAGQRVDIARRHQPAVDRLAAPARVCPQRRC